MSSTQIDKDHQDVLEALSRSHGAMPFLELTSRVPLDDDRLNVIVSELSDTGLVKVINPDDVVEKIVTLTREETSKLQRLR